MDDMKELNRETGKSSLKPNNALHEKRSKSFAMHLSVANNVFKG
jgi:hypothetical protein